MGQTRRSNRPFVPALFQIGLPACVNFFMLRRQCFATIIDYILGEFALLFDLFGESRQKNSGVGDDRQIHRRQFLKIARPAPHDNVFERDIDHFAPRFGCRHVGVRVGIAAHQRAIEVGNVEAHDHVGIGDQLAVSPGEIERVRIEEIQTRAEIDHRYGQQIGECNETQHRLVIPANVVREDHRVLRRRQKLRCFLDSLIIGLQRCRRAKSLRVGQGNFFFDRGFLIADIEAEVHRAARIAHGDPVAAHNR